MRVDDPILDVSRETTERLRALQGLVEKWTVRINLISKATTQEVWNRHIIDSAQIFSLAPSSARSWADLGSGGGFPGLVVACLAAERNPGLQITLVESDQRKCVFLRYAASQLDLSPKIRDERIEETDPIAADIVSARALAPLAPLCAYAHRHLTPTGFALFHKGAQYRSELPDAERHWHFRLTPIQSTTDPAAVIMKLEGLTHA
jgi:16S rRNA (guanine527-N7)-methyltransferase